MVAVYPVSDVLFHIEIANELTHTVPPQAPLFAGHPLSYHYGMDLAVAMFAMDFLQTDAHPGDVVLPADNLIAPVLALTICRVPVGYFSFGLVARSEYTLRETAEKKFWNDWRLGKVEDGLLQDANVRYVVVNKQTEGIPATIPASLSNVFENSELAVFKVDPQRLSETVPQTP